MKKTLKCKFCKAIRHHMDDLRAHVRDTHPEAWKRVAQGIFDMNAKVTVHEDVAREGMIGYDEKWEE
jgi:hypothetical protein